MASVKFFLKEPKSDKPTLLYMYLMSGQQRFKVSTKKKIHPKDWDQEKQQARRSYNGYAEFNIYLSSFAVETEKTYNRFLSARREFSLDEVQHAVAANSTNEPSAKVQTIFTFIEEYIQRNIPLKSKLTIKSYRNTKNHLLDYQKWDNNRKLHINSFDLTFYDKFTGYLFTEKKLSNNSVSNQIKNLKVFLNEAAEMGLITNLDFKKKRFKKMEQDSDSVYLNESEIQAIYDLDLSTKPSLDRVRDLFIIGCWTGLRFSDFTKLRKENIGEEMITIRTQKTDQPVIIPIHRMVRQILTKYTRDKEINLPNTISNQKMNVYLKEVARTAGLDQKIVITISRGKEKDSQTYPKYELITSHCARRSFATNVYLQGFPSISIMKITGHKTEKAFLKYTKVSQEENAKKLMEFWKGKNT